MTRTGTEPRVAALMTRRLVAIVPEATTMVALRLMITSGVRHLPVVSGARVLGVVTETDLLHALADPGGDRRPVAMLAWPAVTVGPGDDRAEASRRMWEAGADAVLVVEAREDGTERLTGIVTATDVLHSLADGAP